MFDLDLIFKLSRGRSLIISNRLIGERYADNSLMKHLSVLIIFLTLNIQKKYLVIVKYFLGVNNTFNQEYFDNIRINAFGKRYYEPAPKRNFYFGLNLSF